MLDFDLAEIYGFATSAFNQQVKRNIERFDNDFRFQLTREEADRLSISQNVTSIQTKGVRGGRAKLPYAFTEAGIYMLMTVLKGSLAIQQSNGTEGRSFSFHFRSKMGRSAHDRRFPCAL